GRGVHEAVVDQDAAGLQHALLVGERGCRDTQVEVEPMLRRRCARSELDRESLADRGEVEALAGDREPARVEAREVEQVGRELLQPRHLLARLAQELRTRLLVQILAREQLEKAAEREERRAQLVRGVRDEVAPGAVERGELL